MTKTSRADAGFSLIEVLVATAIMLTVTGAIFTLLNPSGGMFQAQPEVVDIQQRLRIGVDTLTRDLIMAGAGAYSGTQSGSLGGFFAPIQPSKQGSNPLYDDGPGAYTTNAITLFYVPSTSSQTTISSAMPNTSAELKVNAEPGCPASSNLCGFTVGMTVLLYDDTGAYDTMTITNVQDGGADHLQHNQQGDLSKSYGIGAKVVQVQQHSYFLDTVKRQLMHYDGLNAPVPLLDEVVGLTFEYYGEPAPPALKDGNGLTSQAVTYGPLPPAIGAVKGTWPAGTNCTIQMAGGIQTPRLASLGGVGSGLVKLTQAQLTDGPWCPDATNPNRFDADLFRIRKVRVTLRLQTGNSALRGTLTGGPDALWTSPGTGKGERLVTDQQVRFDVTPRNMSLAR
jgi:prepilin-type N-terminal cleavage/methylation domain-containing protein